MVEKPQVSQAAIQLVKIKLEIWTNEFKSLSTHNPIPHVESRIKSPESIGDKLKKLGLSATVEAVEENILDLAGVRVDCRYIDDSYKIAGLIERSDM